MLQQGILLVCWCDEEAAYLHLVPIAALALMIGFWFGLVGLVGWWWLLHGYTLHESHLNVCLRCHFNTH